MLTSMSWAQTYPHKEVHLIVPFPPGGITDLTARVVANHMTKKWGQKVTVVNKIGEGGTSGTLFVLKSPADGYTMMMSATGQATQNPALDSKLPYRWDEPTLVARTNLSPLVFVVKGDSAWTNLSDVMAAVKKNPTQYRYGLSGTGGVGSIALAQLIDAAGVNPNDVGRVPLQGGAPLLAAVVDGTTHFAAQYQAEMRDLIAGKKIRPLAVSTPQRTPELPDVPSGREAGFPAFSLIGWNGVVGPANLPPEVIAKWDTGVREMVRDPEFLAEMSKMGATAAYLGPQDFKTALQAEYETALQFAMRLGIRK